MWADVFGDPERVAVDYLAAQVAQFPSGLHMCTVGVVLPADWTVSAPPHLAVALDFDSVETGWGGVEAALFATVRVTAWAEAPTKVKLLARVARTAMLAYPSRPNTGMLVTRDPDNLAPIAAFSVRMAFAAQAA